MGRSSERDDGKVRWVIGGIPVSYLDYTNCVSTAPALKTVRWRSGGERCFALCDSCWLPISGSLWIVPGPVRCFGKCRSCGSWFALAELSDLTAGGKWDASSGLCPGCTGG